MRFIYPGYVFPVIFDSYLVYYRSLSQGPGSTLTWKIFFVFGYHFISDFILFMCKDFKKETTNMYL